MTDITTTEYTGLLMTMPEAIRGDEQAIAERKAKRATAMIEDLAPILDALQDDEWLVDDLTKQSFPSVLHYLGSVIGGGGSVLVGKIDGAVFGLQILERLFPGWKAHWHAWIHPQARGSEYKTQFFNEGLEYAFAPLQQDPRGLGLQKLFAPVAGPNARAQAAFHKLGFATAGLLRHEAWVNGQLVDVVLLEKYKPQVIDEGEHGFILQSDRAKFTSVLPVNSDDAGRQPRNGTARDEKPDDSHDDSVGGDVPTEFNVLHGVQPVLQQRVIQRAESAQLVSNGHEPVEPVHAASADGATTNAKRRKRSRLPATKSKT